VNGAVIRGRIAEVAPDSEFEGVAFTQVVTVELSSGQRLRLHDWMALGSPDHVGKDAELEVHVFEYGRLELFPPGTNVSHGIRQDSHRPVGEVTGRIEGDEDGELRLDFGGGSLALVPRDEDRERLGSRVAGADCWARVPEARFDLTRISRP